ncbi:MAG: MBOAT family protein, partial [Nitrospirae bacterium]|nr:MBOAT family protein [Nitrospirota bacterium]
MLLVASYVFYAFWDWRFLSLVLTSTVIDYFCGIKIDEAKDIKRKKLFLLLSVCGNLSILGFFKYFNFFSYNLQVMLNSLGLPVEPHLFHIILPIGISFYTFKTLSYTIEIYWELMKPTKNFMDYALFVAFFPTILSGPIDRARHFLPQILFPRKLTLDKFYQGAFLIFWGFFLKVFIA